MNRKKGISKGRIPCEDRAMGTQNSHEIPKAKIKKAMIGCRCGDARVERDMLQPFSDRSKDLSLHLDSGFGRDDIVMA
ncbi:MAG: hypothetical protein ACLFPU_01240 [Dehalococcoidia bacterium]